MAWSWSHTQEAYDDAREILGTWEREKIIEAILQDEGDVYIENPDDPDDYDTFLAKRIAFWSHPLIPHDVLADHAWGIAEKNAVCSNGGHVLYIDRNGWYGIELP